MRSGSQSLRGSSKSKMPPFETITYDKANDVASIYLNRPRVRNAFNTVMRDELYQVLEAVRDDPEVRVAVLAGQGLDFCAGADLTEFGTAPSMVVARSVRWERDLWGLFLDLGKPLIAAIHGHCLGSGVEMAMLCDLRIASEDAIFGMPETGLGLIPAGGGTQTFPRSLGLSRSLLMLLTGQTIGAREALSQGLVTAVVSKGRLVSEALQMASHLARLDPTAVSALKEALRHGPDLSLDQGLELEARLALRLMSATAV